MENVEVGSFAESPLKPLRNRLSLLKALGLPLRIEDEEATVVKSKRTCIFFAFFLLFWAVAEFPAPIAINIILYNSNETWNIQKSLYQKNGLSKWALNGESIFYSIFIFLPFIYLPFYRGLGPKFEKFIKDYQSISMKLGHGEV